MIKQQLMPSDVKKANDLVPTMMIINFVTTRGDSNATPIRSQAVIGIKAKLYRYLLRILSTRLLLRMQIQMSS